MNIHPAIPDGWFPIARRLAVLPRDKYLDVEDAWMDEELRIDSSPLTLSEAYTLHRRGSLMLCTHRGSESIMGNQLSLKYLIGRFINKKPTHVSAIRYGK